MFGTLIESRAVRQRHTGSSVASVVIHSVIITGGIITTANHVVTPPPPPLEIHSVSFVPPVDPRPAATRARQVGSASVAAAPFLQHLTVPTIVPVGIPPVDLTASPTPYDVGPGPIRSASLFCERDCATASVVDSAGRALWSANDVMMRLLEEPVPPRYPEVLRRAGIEGDVVVRFVVDTTGRVDMRTIEVVRSTHGAFSDAVRETIGRLRFAPGAAGERKVRALAVMPFHFTLK